MGQRSRKRRREADGRDAVAQPAASASAESGPGSRPRGAQRDEAVRATLEPLASGERPLAVTVAAFVALALVVLVLVGYFTHTTIGTRPTVPQTTILIAVLLAAAGGMWRARYWAVLGFEMLLAFQLVVAFLSLLVAGNLLAVALEVAVIGLGGWLFYKLIRAMARIQMPSRSPD